MSEETSPTEAMCLGREFTILVRRSSMEVKSLQLLPRGAEGVLLFKTIFTYSLAFVCHYSPINDPKWLTEEIPNTNNFNII